MAFFSSCLPSVLPLFVHQTKDQPYETIVLEVKGPGGCGLLVQLLTANKIKTKSELNTILRKNG